MTKIPFKVSARMALLIGRENVATAKGALIELVKNCYDADSPVGIIHFDNKYAELPKEINFEDVSALEQEGIGEEQILAVYCRGEDSYLIKTTPLDPNELANFEASRSKLKKDLARLNAIYILDFGDGMTKGTIENYWMTIGTDNKLANAWTPKRRVKSGAKGIGRFALDRLGGSCEMVTFFSKDAHLVSHDEKNGDGYRWSVNWNEFDAPIKTISEVSAELNTISASFFLNEIKVNAPSMPDKLIKEFEKRQYGTLLKISNLRDTWSSDAIDQVFSDLEVLIPPKDTEDFRIIVSSSLSPGRYGEILSTVCDDYDYKLIADAKEDKEVEITLYRNEYDVESIPDVFFSRPEIAEKERYSKATFLKGYWSTTMTLDELVPGLLKGDSHDQFNEIGPFKFSLYFLKRGAKSSDQVRFFYKKFAPSLRKDWLSKFGGIKLFRDNFRVRPYGDVNDVAFDWLGLASRKSANPAGVAKSEGGYRIEPENIAGAIKISRLTNLNFEDKSSREGLQENNTFKVFKNVIAGLIKQLEDDRAYIAREMAAFDNERFGGEREIRVAEDLAKRIMQRARERLDTRPDKDIAEDSNQISADARTTTLAHLVELKNEQIERLEEEQKLLRGLASSGIISAAFGHDLSKLSETLKIRVDKLKSLLTERIDESDYQGVSGRKNPFEILRRMQSQDEKIQNWLNFSLGFSRKDKRKRKQLILDRYFNEFKTDWSSVLAERAIELNVAAVHGYEIRAFEIDFDSIFSNLLVNSIDAFVNSKLLTSREIHISCEHTENELFVEYRDNGPGLNKGILDPEKIFDPLYTTKRNVSGEEIGTGLGMWIIKSVVHEYGGTVKLIFPPQGFGVRIKFPVGEKATK